MTQTRLKIVVIDEDKARAFEIVDALCEEGDVDITVLGDFTGLARKLPELKPDLILVDFQSPNRDRFEQILAALAPAEQPVAMFVEKSDPQLMKSAIEAGVSAYVVDGLRMDRIKPILEMATARFHGNAKLRAELDAAKTALEDRKVMDRAKGVLMKARGVSEEEAYTILRKAAMDQGVRIAQVAANLVLAAGLLS
ncbi:MAG: two-component system response regulator [Rhodobacteraceae bacterium]|nr:MAG: two-component system response regulator [Paracoccaceae bacterium]